MLSQQQKNPYFSRMRTPASFCLNVRKMGGPFLFLAVRMTIGRGEGRSCGVREGGVAYPFPVCQGEGEIALDLSLVCVNAGLNLPESSLFISEQGSKTMFLLPFAVTGAVAAGTGVAGCAGGAGGAEGAGWGA